MPLCQNKGKKHPTIIGIRVYGYFSVCNYFMVTMVYVYCIREGVDKMYSDLWVFLIIIKVNFWKFSVDTVNF